MTLKEFANKCWYLQNLAVVDYDSFDQNLDLEDQAIVIDTPQTFHMHSVAYEDVLNRKVMSYGVIDGAIVVEVRDVK